MPWPGIPGKDRQRRVQEPRTSKARTWAIQSGGASVQLALPHVKLEVPNTATKICATGFGPKGALHPLAWAAPWARSHTIEERGRWPIDGADDDEENETKD